jgi:hydrogenase small subunit
MSETFRDLMERKGYSRSDFLKFAGLAAAAAGVQVSGFKEVVEALESKPRPPIIWLHSQECTCCSESFIRSSHPLVADVVFDYLSLDYTETLMAAAGFQAEAAKKATMEKYKGQYILLCEGSVPTKDSGIYCAIAGQTAEHHVKEAAENAAAVIAWGSCASNGCVQSANPNPTGATPIHKIISKPVIRVPGCPPIAEVMVGIVTHILVYGKMPALDAAGRPKEFYSRRVHDTCYRRPNYDAGLFVESFDDENARNGYCLYKMGCRGPMTYNACAVTGWNNGTSFPIKSGHPCLGCSEDGFWDYGRFYEHLGNVPGFGIENNADIVGGAVAAATAVGIAAHAVATNVRKKDIINENKEETGK